MRRPAKGFTRQLIWRKQRLLETDAREASRPENHRVHKLGSRRDRSRAHRVTGRAAAAGERRSCFCGDGDTKRPHWGGRPPSGSPQRPAALIVTGGASDKDRSTGGGETTARSYDTRRSVVLFERRALTSHPLIHLFAQKIMYCTTSVE